MDAILFLTKSVSIWLQFDIHGTTAAFTGFIMGDRQFATN